MLPQWRREWTMIPHQRITKPLYYPLILSRQMAPVGGNDPPWTFTQPRLSRAVPFLSAKPAYGAVTRTRTPIGPSTYTRFSRAGCYHYSITAYLKVRKIFPYPAHRYCSAFRSIAESLPHFLYILYLNF